MRKIRIRFDHYIWCEEFEIEENRLIGIFQPSLFKSESVEENVIKDGIYRACGSLRLKSAVRGKKRVLILSDDISRPTPVKVLLHYILDEIYSAGIQDHQITFLMALGTHRPMTNDEIDQKLGDGIRSRFGVYNHRWNDSTIFKYVGKTRRGLNVYVNKLLVESDFVIGIGNVVPHPAAGFAGGGKIVNPGCVNEETCGAFHWESIMYPSHMVVGNRNNPMINMIDEVARVAGLKYIVNTVLDGRGKIHRIFAGDPVEAHRKACKEAIKVYGVKIPRRAKIVICDSYPADLEMWQAIKGLCTADLCMEDGGVVIMVTPCPEGVSKEHPVIERYGYLPFSETSRLVEKKFVSMVEGHHMVQGGRLLERASKVFIVSPGLSPEVIKNLHFEPARTVNEALEKADKIVGRDADIIVLKKSAEIFPIFDTRLRRKNCERCT